MKSRTTLKLAAYTFGFAGLVILGAMFFAYSMASREVRVTRQMMDDASRLQVGQSNLSDALEFAHKYKADAAGSWHKDPCFELDCLVMADPPSHDYWSRHPKLSYAVEHVLRRGWHFHIYMWVKGGKLSAIEQGFGYFATRGSAFVITEVSKPGRRVCQTPSYRLHQAFATYPSPHHFNIWVNPAATQEKEMLRLYVECILRIAGCKTVSDMAPEAWRKYTADQPFIQGRWRDEIAADPQCTPPSNH